MKEAKVSINYAFANQLRNVLQRSCTQSNRNIIVAETTVSCVAQAESLCRTKAVFFTFCCRLSINIGDAG